MDLGLEVYGWVGLRAEAEGFPGAATVPRSRAFNPQPRSSGIIGI